MDQEITEFVACVILLYVLHAVWNKLGKEVRNIYLVMFPQNYLKVPLPQNHHPQNDCVLPLVFYITLRHIVFGV